MELHNEFGLIPGGILQLYDVLQNGYWHARSAAFGHSPLIHMLEWARVPGDFIFITVGVAPLVIAAFKTYLGLQRRPGEAIGGGRGVAGEAA